MIWHRMLYSCTHMASVGVQGLSLSVNSLYLMLVLLLRAIDSFALSIDRLIAQQSTDAVHWAYKSTQHCCAVVRVVQKSAWLLPIEKGKLKAISVLHGNAISEPRVSHNFTCTPA